MGLQKLQMKKGALGLYIVLLGAALLLMLSLRQCSVKRIGPRADDVAGGDTLNIAIEISPTGLSLAGDTLSGQYYDMLRRVLPQNGVAVKFHPFTRLEDALQWLKVGRCRLVVGEFPVTSEMREELIFVQPIGVDKQVLVQQHGDTVSYSRDSLTVRNQFDLAGKNVHVVKGSPFVQRLRNLSREIGDTIYITEDSIYSAEQLVILTAIGEIPYTVVNRTTAQQLSRRYPSIDYSVDVSFNQFQSWALAPGDTILRDSLNHWLSATPPHP